MEPSFLSRYLTRYAANFSLSASSESDDESLTLFFADAGVDCLLFEATENFSTSKNDGFSETERIRAKAFVAASTESKLI